LVLRIDPTDRYPDVTCPRCAGTDKRRLMTACRAVVFTNPRGTSKGDSFTYVAGYNMEQAKDERRKAEAVAGGKTNPYPMIDDVSGGEYFGEVE
jgi:hypothetical protein